MALSRRVPQAQLGRVDVTKLAEFVLTLACPNRPGIVAAVANLLLAHGGNITDAQQFDDAETARFFMRVVFAAEAPQGEAVRASFADVAAKFAMEWRLNDRLRPRQVL